MATIVEIRQKLFQGGMTLESAAQAARILADMPAFTAPSGGVFDTLTGKGYTLMSRPVNTLFRLFTNEKKTVLVMTKDGLNSVFTEVPIETL